MHFTNPSKFDSLEALFVNVRKPFYQQIDFVWKEEDGYWSMLSCCFDRKDCYFVDLFVRVSNEIATSMYTRLGYTVYRKVLEYYSGDPDEDAYGKYVWLQW